MKQTTNPDGSGFCPRAAWYRNSIAGSTVRAMANYMMSFGRRCLTFSANDRPGL